MEKLITHKPGKYFCRREVFQLYVVYYMRQINMEEPGGIGIPPGFFL
jgi:hypothetical protein